MSASRIEIESDALVLHGPIPAYDGETLASLEKNLSEVKSIRCFSVNFDAIPEELGSWFGGILGSRSRPSWDRIVLAYCSGSLPKEAVSGLVKAERLEVYGRQLNGVFAAVGDALGGKQGAPACATRILRLRTVFEEASMATLVEGLSRNRSLEQLHLTCEFRDAESVALLAKSLRANQHLRTLNFYSCEFFDEASTASFLASLRDHPSLTSLQLRDNHCFRAAMLSDLLKTDVTDNSNSSSDQQQPPQHRLEHLAVYHPPQVADLVGAPRLDASVLAESLEANTSLRSLNLSSNALRFDEAVALARVLRTNTTLETLNLQGNLLDDDAILVLAAALPEAKGLKRLYLWNNPFGREGAVALANGLRQNKVLEEITTFTRFDNAGEIQYYTNVNQTKCWDLLRKESTIPQSLWPVFLGKVGRQHHWETSNRATIIYTVLRNAPSLWSSR